MVLISFAYLNAALAAVNGYIFLAYDKPFNGAIAIFSALVAIILAAQAERP